MKFSNRSHASSLLATIPLLLSAGLAQAQTTGGVKTVYLLARPLSSSETVHDAGTDVPMWGYQTCQQLSSGRVSDCTGAVQSPGPVIRMDPSETTLRIYLGSCLPNLSYLQSLNGLQSNGTALSSITTSATSIVIPDIPKALSPVTFADAEGRRRVLSFDQMAIRAPSNDEQCALEQPATLYEWTNVQPGTYLYQSGTSPQVQVQMGLYGAVIKNQSGSAPAAAGIDFGVAYDPAQSATDPSFSDSRVLIWSEIDPTLHEAVAANRYSNTSCVANPSAGITCPTSTLDFKPRFFRINVDNLGIVPSISTGARTLLLRNLNAGIDSHSFHILPGYVDVLGEDGRPNRIGHPHYNTLLAAGKTQDVLLTATGPQSSTVYDRRLRLVKDTVTNSGMSVHITMGGGPVAVDDVFPMPSGNGSVGSVLTNDAAASGLTVTDISVHWHGNYTNLSGLATGNVSLNNSSGNLQVFNTGALPNDYVGDTTFMYTVHLNSNNALIGGPATVHLYRDLSTTGAQQYHYVSDAFSLAGRIRGPIAAGATVRIVFNGCGTNDGQPIGPGADAIPVTADAEGNGTWAYTGGRLPGLTTANNGNAQNNCRAVRLIADGMTDLVNPGATYQATLDFNYSNQNN